MFRLILWLVLILVAARILYRFGAAILEGAGLLQRQSGEPSVGLVRDPVCGVFVAPAQALTSRSAGKTTYFCSEKCRTAWDRRG